MTEERQRPRPDDYFKNWKEREALAEGLIPLVGRLSREKNVKCYIYGRTLVNRSVLEIMKDHRYVRQVEGNELSEFETYPGSQDIIKNKTRNNKGRKQARQDAYTERHREPFHRSGAKLKEKNRRQQRG